MAPLSERQQQAASLTHQLQLMGAFVVSPLPLADHAPLRFQVLDDDRDFILSKLASWNYLPALKNTVPRMTNRGPEPSSVYEINLPKPRVVVVDTRIVPRGEVVEQERRQSAAELKAMRKHLGLV
jgi:hypothetical protein